MKDTERKRVVIDADNSKLMETFDKSETSKIVAKYESHMLWDDISVDQSGDIILWRE